MNTTDARSPLYERIKQYILERIDSGEWTVGSQIPSENELVVTLSASRMTVHRALRELTAEGRLSRAQGIGTFVEAPRIRHDFLEIRDIAEELAVRGMTHRAEVLKLESVRADQELAMTFGIHAGAKLFHSVILHYEDELPIQHELRYIAPSFAPDYLAQDFSILSATSYLNSISLASEVEHVVFATRPDKETHRLLRIAANDPCLLLVRRTWVDGMAATKSLLTYPGTRFSLGSRYSSKK